MNKFIRIVFILFYLLCMLTIYLSMVDKYDVVYDMDPTLPQGSLNTSSSDNGKIFGELILFFIFISQIVFFYFEKSQKWKWVTGIMTALAFLFFFIR